MAEILNGEIGEPAREEPLIVPAPIREPVVVPQRQPTIQPKEPVPA